MDMWRVAGAVIVAGVCAAQAFEDVAVVSLDVGSVVELSAGDVDGDGIDDLVVEFVGVSEGFGVALGDGLGGFGEPALQPGVTPGIVGHLLADVDGDGVLELVVLETARDVVVSSFVDGAFAVDQVLELPDNGVALAVGRLDRDAFDDVLVANASIGRIHVARGSAGGLVSTPDLLGLVGAADIALGDVDGNGFTDVLVLHESVSPGDELVVLSQRPDGGFERIEVDVVDGVGSGLRVESGDVDGDGIDDVAVATTAGPPRVALGAPGGLGAFVGLSADAPRADLHDFDGDGDVEILDGEPSAFSTNVRLYDWNGDGFDVLAAPGARAAVADFDRDGFPDGAFGAPVGGVDVLAGTGALAWRTLLPFGPEVDIRRVTGVGDVDRDGVADLVVGVPGAGIFVTYGGAPSSSPQPVDVPGDDLAALVDVNLDGILDIVSLDEAPGGSATVVTVSAGDGSGGFVRQRSSVVDVAPSAAVESGDFTGDGLLDVIVTPGSGTYHVLAGDGAGGFALDDTFDVATSGVVGPVIAADADDDGDLDLFLVTFPTPTATVLSLLRVDGGRFGPPEEVVPTLGGTFAVGDVDGDGIVDLVTNAEFDPSGTRLALWRGEGGGSFGDAVEIDVASTAVSLAIADIDGDGLRDIVVASVFSASVVAQTSPGVFVEGGVAGIPSASLVEGRRRPVVVDLDDDGRLDVVVPLVPNNLAILRPAAPTWTSLGESLAGPDGFSALDAEGPLLAGGDVTVTVPNGPPHTVATLVVGLSAANTPFLGGILVPQVDATARRVTNAAGKAQFTFRWADPPPGAEVFVQAWFPTVPASTIALRGAPPD